jgi:hypothetical protein
MGSTVPFIKTNIINDVVHYQIEGDACLKCRQGTNVLFKVLSQRVLCLIDLLYIIRF